jgi:tubulin polyglutamylase TTLL6/13
MKGHALASAVHNNEPLSQQQIIVNISYTQYEIIHDVAAECNFRTSHNEEEEDWDLWFIDGPV